MACDPFAPCECCKSACCCSRQGSRGGHECCQANCAACEAAHGEGTSPGQNCSSSSVSNCNSSAMIARLPLGFCCEETTDECLNRTTECECNRENGGYTNPCTGSSVPDNDETWVWAVKPDCENPNLPCCPCGSVCCLGEGDECCDSAEAPPVCCRGSLGQACCDGVCCNSGEVCCDGICCDAGQVCVNGVCQEGCTQDADCQSYYFDCDGVTYGPYEGGVNCAAAAAATCPGPPVPECYTVALEEKFCCGGTCQDTPCNEGASLLSLPGVKRLAAGRTRRIPKRWRKLLGRIANLPRPWHGPGSALKLFLSLMGINASPHCGCNKKAKEMDSKGAWWSIRHSREIVGFMAGEAKKRNLPFHPSLALVLVVAACMAAAITLPLRRGADTRR